MKEREATIASTLYAILMFVFYFIVYMFLDYVGNRYPMQITFFIYVMVTSYRQLKDAIYLKRGSNDA